MEIAHVHSIGKRKVYNRLEYIVGRCKNQKVLHVGACDHIQNINSKIASDTWLHAQINTVSSECIGIDIDKKSIQLCHNSGVDNIYYYDVYTGEGNSTVTENDYDICVLGEVIEHLGDVKSFLVNLKNLLSPTTVVLITVPNAFWIKNLFSMLRSVENCNSDHWYYFSPTTLKRMVDGTGYKLLDFVWHGKGAPGINIPIKAQIKENLIWKIFPHLADGIIGIVKIK